MGEAGGILFKGHSSRLQLLIEKIQANKENHIVTEQDLKDALGTEGVSSWTGSEGQSSPRSSCATPNSATELADSELAFTVGVTEATPYACQFCDKAFPRLSYLKKHEQTHSDHLPFICEFCKRRFKHKRSKDRHLKLHTGDKRYKCSQCQAAFARSDHLKIHMKTHDNQKPFQCTVCNRGYNTAAALTSHMQNHKKTSEPDTSPSGSTFKCLDCSEIFAKPEQLTNHMMIEHQGNSSRKQASPTPAKLGCMYCTKDNFGSLEALQLHIQAMHGSLLKGSRYSSYTKGMYLPNGLSSSGYACRLCTMVFPSAGTLQAHAAVAHGIRELEGMVSEDHQCPQCSLTFRSLNAFAEHFVLNHGPPPPGKAKPTDQVHPTDLSIVRKEQNDKPPAPKRSRAHAPHVEPPRSSSLVVQYDHPGILLCNQCNAALPDFESFRSHLKSHLEESAYSPAPPPPSRLPQLNVCSYCGAHLQTSEELSRHIGTHFLATITEYGCQSCYQLFNKPEDLQKHLLETHAQHWYRCTLCKELFESQAAIQVHFAVKHCSETKQYKCAACPNAPPLHSELEFSLHVRAAHSNFNLSPNPPVISSPRLHRCIFCNLTFSSEIEMQFHLTVHTKLFQCPLCSEAFHVEYFLEKHMQICHPNQNSSLRHSTFDKKGTENDKIPNGYHQPPTSMANFNAGSNTNSGAMPETNKRSEHNSQTNNNCNSNKNNNSNSHSNNNNVNNNNNNIGVCDICESGEFASEAELNAHRKLVHHLKTSSVTKVSLHCAYCKESCKSRTELENHMKSYCQAAMGSSKHKCNICDELCLSAAILAEHKLTHCKVVHGSTCTHCKALITNEEGFISHSIQHSNANGGSGHQQLVLPNACVICRQTLTSEMETRLHAKFHLQMEVNKCSVCLQNYDRGDLADGVCKTCHKRSRSSPCMCMHCHLHFESPSILDVHLAKVHKKTFQCSKCKETFESEKDYENHCSQICGSNNVYKCCLCLLLFPGPNQLQAHLIEHTFAGCPNFTCYICSAVFTTAPGLQNHILEHGLSARPYDCSKCTQKFFFRAELENHSFVHGDGAYLANDSRPEKHFIDHASSLMKTEPEENCPPRKSDARPSSNGLNLTKPNTDAKFNSQSQALAMAANTDRDIFSDAETCNIKKEVAHTETVDKSLNPVEPHENTGSITIKTERE